MRYYFVLLVMLCACGNQNDTNYSLMNPPDIGETIDSLNSVPVYYNGLAYTHSQGKHFSESGYYYGQKGQCVEYVKRFYFDALGHEMPDVWGHAISFYNPEIKHGKLNPQRDLLQFKNGHNVKPKKYDIMVFPYSKYGHVAIVSVVTDNRIQVIQQNMRLNTREWYDLDSRNGQWTVHGSKGKPVGWLRIGSGA